MRNILQIPREYLKKLTPGMRQWWEIKCDNFDTVLMFKVSYAISSHQPCSTWRHRWEIIHVFVYVFFILNQEQYVFCFMNVWNFSAWGRNYEKRPQARFFNWRPLPTSVYLGKHQCHSHDKMGQGFPLRFCILQVIKNWTVGRKAWERGWV